MSRLRVERLNDLPIHRICYNAYNPWLFRDWSTVTPDLTFGYRWDDPRGEYRALYAAKDRVACFIETLQIFAPPADILALHASLSGESGIPNSIDPGVVPPEWAAERIMGDARVSGDFAAVSESSGIGQLRLQLSSAMGLAGLGEFDFDLSTLLIKAPRSLSQAASRAIYEDGSGFSGILCPSRFGTDLLNVTLFEDPDSRREMEAPKRANLRTTSSNPIEPHDSDFAEALDILNLTLG